MFVCSGTGGGGGRTKTSVRKCGSKQNSINILLLLLQFGNMNADLTRYNTDMFAQHVLPQIKDLFENEWEDKWWPNPLPAAQRGVAKPFEMPALGVAAQ